MQLICEAYHIFKAAGFTNAELADIFDDWNKGDLESYLIEITANIFRQHDSITGQDLVDVILDRAGQKGTGRWTVMGSVEQAVPFSTIAGSVEARILSSMRDQRKIASGILQGPSNWDFDLTMSKEDLVKKVRNALYASKIVSYAQGLDLITKVGADKWMAAQLRSDRSNVAWWLYHSCTFPQPHHRGLHRSDSSLQPYVGRILHEGSQRRSARLA